MGSRNKTPSNIIGYGLYLYFLGLSFRNLTKALLSFLKIINITHISIWKWIQKYRPWKHIKNKNIKEYVIDETAIKIGSKLILLWIVIEPTNKEIFSFWISKKRNMFVAKRFLTMVITKYGKHQVSTSDGGTWYLQTCRFMKLNYHLHSSYEKSIIERTIPYIKDRTEIFDDYFPCKKNKHKLNHIKQWLKLFVYEHKRNNILS